MKAFKNITLVTAILASVIGTHALAGDSDILTDGNGMTLYTFDKDKQGESVCYGACAVSWPPFLVGENAKTKKGFDVITRKDGSKQWTYKNQPLYTWVGDSKPGDTNGDGVQGVWHVANEKAAYAMSDSSGSASGY